ncbi:hypothetical protein [Priestia megaterium]|uniref:hypothetical protein n=1 Tax=Priestia megaterium TaxID=1404 RepID=UPI002E1F9DA3|nr:hypothetical protein [Priestia megaterium]
MKGLILLQALADQSTNADEVMKQSEELKKQIADLQDTLISTQNDKIANLIGDTGLIVGVFGLIFTLFFGLSVFAVIYIQHKNNKAKEDMASAKKLSANAEELSKKGNQINQQASEELKEVQKKMLEIDYLMKFTQKHSWAFAKINRCRSNLDTINVYIDTNTYSKSEPGVYILGLIKELKVYQERRAKLHTDLNMCYAIVNSLVDNFYQYVNKVEEISHMQIVIDNLDKQLSKLEVLDNDSEQLLEEVSRFYKETMESRKAANNPTEDSEQGGQ